MKKLVITWGQDTPCYATSVMEMPDDATTEQIVEAAKRRALEAQENLIFDPSYDFSGLRIVDISESEGATVACEIAIERCGEDLGLVCENVLNGRTRATAIIHEAERQGININEDVHVALSMLQEVERFRREYPIPNFAPFELVIDAFACDEYGDSPSYAKIMVTPESLADMVRIGATCKHIGVRAAHSEDDDSIWNDPGENFIMRNTDLVLMHSRGAACNLSFFFCGHPKHANYNCETRAIELRCLIACIGQTDNLPAGFRRQDGVLFYDGDSDTMDFLMKQYASNDQDEVI